MLNNSAIEQPTLFDLKTRSQIKQLGQFFTDNRIANYMASMIHINEITNFVHILDPGAGNGILTSAVAHRCLELGKKRVHAVLYEIDETLLLRLEETMKQICMLFTQNNGKFSYDICNQDFILSRPDKRKFKYHIAVINPPYFKYNSKTSPYSKATADLFDGNPNIYASFIAVASECLTFAGEMVAIVPRSFTNGLYFKGFRSYLQRNLGFERIHIFKSRNQLFKNMGVLQENIICKLIKSKQKNIVEIGFSNRSQDIAQSKIICYPLNLIIDKNSQHNIIRIPEEVVDGQILKVVTQWSDSFESNGYFVSTGPVVEFRTKDFITTKPQGRVIPLFKMHNINIFYSKWTGKHRKDAYFILKEGYEKHINKNMVYVFLKRFSSKDEKRRLVASVHNPNTIKGELICLENHLNYIGLQDAEMSISEASGLAALFNSTFMDRYFRSISGNTQVNATDIRLLKLPTRRKIIEIGIKIQMINRFEQRIIDKVINSMLNIKNEVANWI